MRELSQPVENYVTHNGDFDFFVVDGQSESVGVVRQWLAKTLQHPEPNGTDSVAVAGLMDLLRTQVGAAATARFRCPQGPVEGRAVPLYSDAKVPNRDSKVGHGATENGP